MNPAMKEMTAAIIALLFVRISIFAQTAGDFRSIANGQWNDPATWQKFDGTNWVNTTSYPGENAGTGAVTIMNGTEVAITTSVPFPISSLYINADFDQLSPAGKLIFYSENAVSLATAGDVVIYGNLAVVDKNGAKTHSLSIGGSLQSGAFVLLWDCYCDFPFPADVQAIDNDDKLTVIFNTSIPGSVVGGVGITLQDVRFDGIGISVETQVSINGTATFVNGIVTSGNLCNGGVAYDASGSYYGSSGCATLLFNTGAIASGASPASFVDGRVWKQGSESFVFPIGDDGVYAPLTISPLLQLGTFSARYVRSGANPSLWGITDPGLYSVSNCEYWELNLGSGGYPDSYTPSPINIAVGWTSSNRCNSSPYITDPANVNLAHFNGTSWDSHGGSASGTADNGTVRWDGITNIGTFTFGNINTTCVTPGQLTSTNVAAYSAALNWSPMSDAVSYDVGYKPTTTNTWTNAATGTTFTALNLSGLNPLTTYDWRVRASCGSSYSAFRVAQFTTENPCGTPAGLTATNISASAATLSWEAVTNAEKYNVMYKQTGSSSWIDAAVGITSLSFNLVGLAASTAYDWSVFAFCNSGNSGYYIGNTAQSSFTTAAAQCNDAYEVNNTASQAKTVNFGIPVSGAISSPTDVDWFKVGTGNNSNTSLKITLSNLPADYDLYVYNKSLLLVASSLNTGSADEIVIYDSHNRNATYYIKVIGKNNAYNAAQCYHLLVEANTALVNRRSQVDHETAWSWNEQLLYPNPASKFVFVHLYSNSKGSVNAEILNTTGQLIKSYPINLGRGYNDVRIPVIDVRAGVYLLRINSRDQNLLIKFVITR